MEGYFSIIRDDAETLLNLPANDSKLFLYLVYRASYKDTPLVKIGALFDSLKGIAYRCGLSVQSTRTSLKNLQSCGLIVKNQHKRRHDIQITRYINPAIANMTSNIQLTRSQHDPNTKSTRLEEVRSKEVRKKNEETDTRSDAALDLELEFQRVWERYPRRLGRKAAFRHFKASIKTAQDVQSIHSALNHYLSDIRSKGTEPQYVQHGSTWLNDWQSWVDVTKPALRAPSESKPPPIPSWKILPKDEDLVDPSEIRKLVDQLALTKIKSMGMGGN